MKSIKTIFAFLFTPYNITRERIENELHFREAVLLEGAVLALAMLASIGHINSFIILFSVLCSYICVLLGYLINAYIIKLIDRKYKSIPSRKDCLRVLCAGIAPGIINLFIGILKKSSKIEWRLIGWVSLLLMIIPYVLYALEIFLVIFYLKKIYNCPEKELRYITIYFLLKWTIPKVLKCLF